MILNNPRLIYNNEEKTCQLNENPEAEQKEAKEKAHWFSAKVAVSKCPATKPSEFHEESPWSTHYSTRNSDKKAHTLPAAPKQNTTVFHVQCIVE